MEYSLRLFSHLSVVDFLPEFIIQGKIKVGDNDPTCYKPVGMFFLGI